MYVYGITGGISSGKSTLSKYLTNEGFFVIDCDTLVHDSYYDEICLKQLKQLDHTIVKNNKVDRTYLRQLVFNHCFFKAKVEEIIHPIVLSKIKERMEQCKEDFVFLDIPLLYEVRWQSLCDEVIVVYVSKSIQIERLMKRDAIGVEDAMIKINNQMDIEEKVKMCDIVLDNNDTIDVMVKQFKEKVRLEYVKEM